jgi:hypothetical protein
MKTEAKAPVNHGAALDGQNRGLVSRSGDERRWKVLRVATEMEGLKKGFGTG